MGCWWWWAHHHGEHNSSRWRLDHPEQYEAGELGDGEQVHLPQGDVAQVDEVWLVLGWHAEQLETVKELRGWFRQMFRHTGDDENSRMTGQQMVNMVSLVTLVWQLTSGPHQIETELIRSGEDSWTNKKLGERTGWNIFVLDSLEKSKTA